MITSNGDARAVRISFLWADLAHYLDMRDFFPLVARDVIVAYDAESVCACDGLPIGTFGAPPDALVEASHLVRVRVLPGAGELGMTLEVSIFKRLARLFVGHGLGEVEEEGLGIMAACHALWAHGRNWK